GGDGREVVAVEGDVEGTHRRLDPRGLLELAGEAPGEGNAAAPDAHERHLPEVRVALHDLVGDAGERPSHVRGIHQLYLWPQRGPAHQRATGPPSGTGRSGMRSAFSPRPLSTVRTTASERRPATCCGGRFTTAATCSPTRSAGS